MKSTMKVTSLKPLIVDIHSSINSLSSKSLVNINEQSNASYCGLCGIDSL